MFASQTMCLRQIIAFRGEASSAQKEEREKIKMQLNQVFKHFSGSELLKRAESNAAAWQKELLC